MTETTEAPSGLPEGITNPTPAVETPSEEPVVDTDETETVDEDTKPAKPKRTGNRINHPYTGPKPDVKLEADRPMDDGTDIWYKGRFGTVVAQDRNPRYVRIQLDGESAVYGKCKTQVFARSEIQDWLDKEGDAAIVGAGTSAEPTVD